MSQVAWENCFSKAAGQEVLAVKDEIKNKNKLKLDPY